MDPKSSLLSISTPACEYVLIANIGVPIPPVTAGFLRDEITIEAEPLVICLKVVVP